MAARARDRDDVVIARVLALPGRRLAWSLRAVLALPFLVAVLVLATKHWSPVLDLAMTELRVRDVGGAHTPLIGLPGRIGTFPDQGSHPGPLSFWLLAPLYRLFGSTAYGLLAATAVIDVAALWVAIWVAGRCGGRRLVLGVAAFLGVATAWYGASVLTQPWNPYLPLVAFLLALLATWAVVDGQTIMLLPLVAAASFCAQTHVPYLTLGVTLCALGFGAVGWRWWRNRAAPRRERWVVAGAALAGLLLWLPPLIDEARHTPGNISMLRQHFLHPPEAPAGIATGVKVILAHFDVWHLAVRLIARPARYLGVVADLDGGSWVVGLLVVLAWAATAVLSLRLPDRRPARLHLVVVVGLVVSVVSAARIFGKVWYYLTLWAWAIALLAVLAAVWTLVQWFEQRRPRPLPVVAATLTVLLVATGLFVRDAARVDVPEPRLSEVLGELVGPTAQALADGAGAADGKGGRYVVLWADAYYFGSQGYGLINELERRGFDAGASPTYHVPVTPQRIIADGTATAEVVLATGVNVDVWRAKPGVVEVADVEPRDTAELAEFERLRSEALDALAAADLPDVAELVDTNLFLASTDPRLPPGVEAKLTRMLELGEETAVFVAPPGTFS
ncbi:MAG: hypothetical protein QM733_15960 [Ilumatobacteraceae bacterium]